MSSKKILSFITSWRCLLLVHSAMINDLFKFACHGRLRNMVSTGWSYRLYIDWNHSFAEDSFWRCYLRNMNWPPRFDFSLLDYFLWGYVKSGLSQQTCNFWRLRSQHWTCFGEVGPQMLEKVVQNWTYRLRFVTRRNGGHMYTRYHF